jgi:ribose transport system substrate-binding protein
MRTTTTLLAMGTALAFAMPALADTSGARIALSNNYAGNSWRQAMLESWEKR